MAARRKRKVVHQWRPLEFFAVPLRDGTFGLIQADEDENTGAFPIALVLTKRVGSLEEARAAFSAGELGTLHAIAAMRITDDVFEDGIWPYVGTGEVALFENRGHVDWRVSYTAGMVQRLLNAWYGLAPWDAPFNPNYFNGLLLPGVAEPDTTHRTKSERPRPAGESAVK